MSNRFVSWGAVLALVVPTIVAIIVSTTAFAADCDKKCLENIGDQYRAAYLKHDPKLAPFAKKVRFVENNVEMEFPDATWDTVTQEIGTPLTLSDPKTGNVGIYTRIMQNDTPGFLVVRLKRHRKYRSPHPRPHPRPQPCPEVSSVRPRRRPRRLPLPLPLLFPLRKPQRATAPSI